MKTTILTALIAMVSVSIGFAGVPEEKLVPVDKVFVPAGFDSNDSVEVIITGFLPNLCHKSPSSKISIKGDVIDVKMTSLYYHETNPFCPEMVVPFTEAVQVGILDKGRYKIMVNGKSPWETRSEVQIAQSTSNSVDEHEYAYVNYIEKEDTARGTVTLKGYNPSDCFVLDKIDYTTNNKDVYSVLPKLKQVRAFCPMKMTPFSYEWRVPADLDAQKVLLHVRTMNGKSVNTLYTK